MKSVIWKIVAGIAFLASVAGAGGPICDYNAFNKAFNDSTEASSGVDNDDEYGGAGWCQNCLGGCHPGNKVPAGMAEKYVQIGCGGKGKTIHYRFKVIVHQSNPCFIVDKNFRKYKSTIKKVNSNTVEIVTGRDDWCSLFLSNHGRVGEDSLYHRPNKKNVKLILGHNLSCVYENNIERWEIFVKDGNKWKPFHTETFVIRKDHPAARWVREHSK